MSVDTTRDDEGQEVEYDIDLEELAAAVNLADKASGLKPIDSLGGGSKASARLLEPKAELWALSVKTRDKAQNISLKRMLAIFAISAVSFQLVVANGAIYIALLFQDKPPSDTVMVAWLSATVIEVIGIIGIIARNLFPDRSKKSRQRSRAGG